MKDICCPKCHSEALLEDEQGLLHCVDCDTAFEVDAAHRVHVPNPYSKSQRKAAKRFIMREWVKRGWLMGNWIADEEHCWVCTSHRMIQGRATIRHFVRIPSSRQYFVFYVRQ